MGAAVALGNVVGEAQHRLVIAVVPPQRRLDARAVALGLDDDRLRHERRLVAVEIFHERLDAALVDHLLALLDRMTPVGEHDAHARIEECELAQAMLERRPVELRHGEGVGRGQERHLGAALARGVADRCQRRLGFAVAEFDEVLLAVAPDRQLEPARERVDDRDADAMQAARHLVGVLVELTAGVQLGHDDLGRRDAFALVDVGRDAAPVVTHGARAVRIERDHHFLGVARERLIDGVVDDLVDHVVEAGAVIRIADIHARTLANGIEALEDLDRFGVVIGRGGTGLLAGGFGHGKTSRGVKNDAESTRLGVTRIWGSYKAK